MKRQIDETFGDSQSSKIPHMESTENIENRPINIPENYQEETDQTALQECICISTKKSPPIANLQNDFFNNLKQHLDIICNPHNENCPKKIISIHKNPLHNAIIENNEKLIDSLCTNQNLINSISNHNLTPLQIAAYKGDQKTAEILLKNGASIDAEFIFNQKIVIPLDLAILGCHKKTVKLLLSQKTKSTTKNWSQNDLYHLSERFDTIKVYLLMSNLDSWNEKRRVSLLNNVDKSIANYENVVCHLLYIRSNFEKPLIVLRDMMYYSVANGFLKIVQDLLNWSSENKAIDYASNVNRRTRSTLLHNAVKGELHDVARLFANLANRAIINYEPKKNQKILCTLEGCKKKILDLLLQHGAARKCFTALMEILAVPENWKTVKIFLSNDRNDISQLCLFIKNVEKPEDNKKNPCLHKIDEFDMTKFLVAIYGVRKSVNIDAQDIFGDTALILAAEKNNAIIVDLLLEFGADVDLPNLRRSTPLIKATENGNLRMIKEFLDKNADIDVKNHNHSTALDIAFQGIQNPGRNFEIIELLLNSGANFGMAQIEHARRACGALHFLREHVVKLSVARMDVNERAFRNIIDSPNLKNFRKICREEYKMLKECKIGESEFSFYFAMTKSAFLLERISRRRGIAEVMEAEYWKVIFPNYWRFVENNYRKGVARRDLMDQALGIFYGLIGANLDEMVQLEILRYLSNKDLKNLIIASTL